MKEAGLKMVLKYVGSTKSQTQETESKSDYLELGLGEKGGGIGQRAQSFKFKMDPLWTLTV